MQLFTFHVLNETVALFSSYTFELNDISPVADPIKPIFFANEEFFRFLLVSLRVCYL